MINGALGHTDRNQADSGHASGQVMREKLKTGALVGLIGLATIVVLANDAGLFRVYTQQ